MDELAVLASETHEKAIAFFKVAEKYGYKFIMQVKKIRDDRLYKELGFSNFDDYCDSAWKYSRRSMDERIQIADSYGEQDFERTVAHIGVRKSLMLARMEPEVREQIESSINITETPVKEIKQLEKQLKETESERIRLENESIYYKKLLNQERSKPSQVVTKEIKVEVVPDKLTKELEQLKFDNVNLKHGFQSTKEKLKQYELRDTVDFNEEQSKRELAKLQQEADVNTVNIRIAYKNFIEKASVTSFITGAIATASFTEKQRLSEMVEAAESIIKATKLALSGRKLGVVNE